MKTGNLCLLFFTLFFFSCEKSVFLQEPPAAPTSLVEAPADSCPYPEYDPPAVVPGTNCNDPCQYVYEGWVDFEKEELVVNCQSLPLSSPALSFSIDSTIIRYVGIGYLKALRIQAPDIGPWCAGKVFFRAEGCPSPDRVFLHVGGDGISEYRVVWLQDFWGCAAGKRIHFRLIAKKPLVLEGDSEP